MLREFLHTAAFVGVLAIVYMAVSSGLITFNKYLMHSDRFPYAVSIGLLHMTCSFGFNALLFRMCPSLYPSLTDATQRVAIDRDLVVRVLLPISGCFAAQLVLSNVAFLHSSVAFLQMMKQSNVVLVYLFSLSLSLETFNFKRATVLLFIVGATALTIHGELNFSLTGFIVQAASMICEGMKLTLQSYSLSATGRRLDALTYVMLVAPMVLCVLSVFLVVLNVFWPGHPAALSLPPWSVIAEQRWLLLANGCLAFAMNISHALFIKNSSAITFILTGVVMKDVVIVIVASIILDELLSPMQVAGFGMQLLGILVWSLMKAVPQLSVSMVATVPLKPGQEWEALHSSDACSELNAMEASHEMGPIGPKTALTMSSCASSTLSKVSSESTMVPLDDMESQASSVRSGPCH
jgi:hypothetical protein